MAFGITQLAGDRLMDFQGCPWTAVVRRRADAGSASFLEILRPGATDLPLGFVSSAARRVRVSGTRHKLGLGFQIGGKFFKPDRVVGQLLPHRDIPLSGRKPSQLQCPISVKPRGVHDRITGSTGIDAAAYSSSLTIAIAKKWGICQSTMIIKRMNAPASK